MEIKLGQIVVAVDKDFEPVAGRVVGINKVNKTVVVRPTMTADVIVKEKDVQVGPQPPEHPKVKAQREAQAAVKPAAPAKPTPPAPPAKPPAKPPVPPVKRLDEEGNPIVEE